MPSVFERLNPSTCPFLMDSHTQLRQFRHLVSLASLAYIFSAIHAIQYSLLDPDDDKMDNNDNNLQSTSHSDFTSTALETS